MLEGRTSGYSLYPYKKGSDLDKGGGMGLTSLDRLYCVWEVKLMGVGGGCLDFIFINSVFRMLLRLSVIIKV